LFYNIYLPFETDGIGNAKWIVREQLGQISAARLDSHASSHVVLYYNTIGNADAITDKFIADQCANFTCVHMHHYAEGFEDLTLTELYHYCDDHADAIVIYLHSKGSFHNKLDRTNEYWRRYLTTAVTSPACLYGVQDTTCNVCGLQFFPVWSTFFPGNFFTSQCSYVNRLLSPNNYSQAMQQIYESIKGINTTRYKPHFTYKLFLPRSGGRYGEGRFSSEHWIGSHPTLRPCDLSPTTNLTYWFIEHNVSTIEMTWDVAPRHYFWNSSWFKMEQAQLNKQRSRLDQRLREYFLLPGHLYRWMTLYKELPPDDSWVWEWYPEGEIWKQLRWMPWQEHSPGLVLDAFAEMMSKKKSNATEQKG
jgi:hypothetical protein